MKSLDLDQIIIGTEQLQLLEKSSRA